MSDVDDESVGKATSLVKSPSDDDQVIRVVFDGNDGKPTFFVTEKARKSMSSSMDAMANQPTIFFKMDFIMQAVADAIEKDKVEISFPHTPEQVQAFDWDNVIIGRKDTYMAQIKPDKDVFTKVHAVHIAVKDEKDKQAKKMGLPKSGVQAWSTYYQRWREWRELCAVYRSMYPDETKEMVYDRIKGRCKLLSSLDKIYTDAVAIDMKRHLDKLKREDRSARVAGKIEVEIEKTEADKEAATAQEATAESNLEQLQQELTALSTAQYAGSKKEKAKARRDDKKEKNNQIKAAKKAKAKASKTAKEKEKQAKSLKRQAEEIAEAAAVKDTPKKPKYRRNDISMLDVDPVPSKRVELDGDNWKPPIRNKGKKGPVAYNRPGNKWAEESRRKVLLLFALARALASDGVMQPPMTFHTLMEFIEPNCAYQFNFDGRVFIYLVALIVNQKV